MELGREAGLTVSESNLTRYDLFNADECFLTAPARNDADCENRWTRHRGGKPEPSRSI